MSPFVSELIPSLARYTCMANSRDDYNRDRIINANNSRNNYRSKAERVYASSRVSRADFVAVRRAINYVLITIIHKRLVTPIPPQILHRQRSNFN